MPKDVSGSKDIYSRRTKSPPKIDGVLETGEWLEPTLIKSFGFNNTITGQYETHLMTLYSVHDDANLFIAAKVTDVQYLPDITPEQGKLAVDVFEIYFTTNDSYDIRNFWRLDYGDWHSLGGGGWGADQTKNGIGKASHSNPSGIGDYVYEFQIPLDSGDLQDMAITSNSSIGILISFRRMYWNSSEVKINNANVLMWGHSWADEYFWPDARDKNRLNGANYGKLILTD